RHSCHHHRAALRRRHRPAAVAREVPLPAAPAARHGQPHPRAGPARRGQTKPPPMKSRLPLLLSALTLGFLLNLGHGLLQRARLFTDQGVAQTITVTEQTDAAWSSLLPPRRLYAYNGRI